MAESGVVGLGMGSMLNTNWAPVPSAPTQPCIGRVVVGRPGLLTCPMLPGWT